MKVFISGGWGGVQDKTKLPIEGYEEITENRKKTVGPLDGVRKVLVFPYQ